MSQYWLVTALALLCVPRARLLGVGIIAGVVLGVLGSGRQQA